MNKYIYKAKCVRVGVSSYIGDISYRNGIHDDVGVSAYLEALWLE